MIDAFLKLPLKKRYAYGMRSVLASGFFVALFSLAPLSNSMLTWTIATIFALTHWTITGTYLWWERRWYRFFLFAFSTLCTWFYIELSLRIWKAS